jgi:hypothetical protein
VEESLAHGRPRWQVAVVIARAVSYLNSSDMLGGTIKSGMKFSTLSLRPGDFVEVKSPEEILQTLDADGTLDRLPFMPEMIDYSGKRFQVSRRVVKTCYYGATSGMRRFPAQDVVLLEGLRCSGAAHDGCQKACTIFWREAWLRKVDSPASVPTNLDQESAKWLRARLKTSISPNTYFCQSSEILNSTVNLTTWERFEKCFGDIWFGNCGVLEMAGRVATWVFWKTRKAVLGKYGHGNRKSTPSESLNLRSGEWVQIKPLASITETLDQGAYNRGLLFTPAMGQLCGEKYRVADRIEKIIVDGTGEMRQLRNTAFLEDSFCGCSCVAFGGCPRQEYAYWREIWVRRVNAESNQTESEIA